MKPYLKVYIAQFLLAALLLNMAPLQPIALAETDTTPPVIDAHADEVVEATSSSGVVVSYVAPNAVDDVDGVFAATCLPASETQFSIGDTIVTCNASDAAGNAAASTSFTVTVIDTTSPVITIIGDSNIEVIDGTPYSDAGATALDTVDGDITSSIVTVNTVDTSVIGNYSVSYNVSDAAGNAAIEVVRSVEVVVAPDTTPPVIDAHADEVVEATSSSGVVVSYVAPNAVDDVDGVFAATCLPASGNVFPLGDTTVICTAADTAGNVAVPTIFTISVSDTAPPTLVEVTPVTTPTNDITPSFTFSSSEDGTITYAGGCLGDVTSAAGGTNAVTLTDLADGTYNTCSLTVTDASGNISDSLLLSSFTIDTVAPVAVLSGTPANPSNIRTADITVGGTDVTHYKYNLDGGAYSGELLVSSPIVLFGLTDGPHTVLVLGRDAAGNWQVVATATEFSWSIDATPPELFEIVPVSSSTNDTTPDYTFSASEAGTIGYAGGCASAIASAVVGSNLITFETLADGIYAVCTITVTDNLGNASSPLLISAFEIDTIAPTAILIGTPAAKSNLTTINITVDNTEATHYRYKLDSGSYSAETSVSTPITASGLVDGPHTISVIARDAAGNWQTQGSATTFAWSIDTVAPIIFELTPVPSPTNNKTPNYSFTTDEAGAIRYGGGCTSVTTNAFVVYNTITFDELADGTYTTCSLTVTDASGNDSNTITITPFIVDTEPPVAILSGTPANPTAQTTIDIAVSGTDVTHYKYNLDGGSYSADTSISTRIALGGLPAGSHTILVIAKDTAGNWQAEESATSYFWEVDLTPPTLSEVTPISSPTNDATPDYTFNSTEAGTITYGGGCTSAASSAAVGNNTLTFNVMADGVYASCTITVTDSVGNVSAPLPISVFTITTLPPVAVLSGTPTNPTNSTSVDITVGGTDVTHYRFNLDGGAYSAEMPVSTHIILTGLTAGSHSISVIAKDLAGNWQAETQATIFTWVVDRTLVEVTPLPNPPHHNTPH